MKLDLYDKVAGSLHDLKEHTKHSATIQNYKVILTPKDNIYMFYGSKENILLEIKNEHTIIDHTGFDRFDSYGHSRFWNRTVNSFARGLEKRLGHKIKIWNKRRLELYEKVKAAAEDLKENGPDHEKTVKDYVVTVSYTGKILVYDSGTIIFEVKDENKMTNKGEFRGIDPAWDELVNFFRNSLEEKLEHKIKLKHKLF